MNTREIVRVIAGSIAVYVVMASCSPGNSGSRRTSANAGANATAGGTTNANSLANGGTTSPNSLAYSGATNAGASNSFKDASIFDPVPDAAAQAATSGSRLKASYYIGADGSKQFKTMHDSQLGVDCSYLTAADGATRCLPSGTAAISYFADSSCSASIATVAKGCQPAKYAINYSQSTVVCSSYNYAVFQIGAAYTGTVYSGTASSCNAVTAATLTALNSDYYTATVVQPGQFVQATVQTDS